MSNSAKEIAQKWSVDIMSTLEQNYISRGQRASGQFGDSLEDKITASDSNLNIQILGAKQIGVMVDGRKPNAKQTPESLKAWVGWAGSTFLKEWVKDKRLSINPYAVAWGIARKGVKVPNDHNDGQLLNETFNAESVDNLFGELSFLYAQTFKSKYMESWQ